jgi:DNA-binding response OmpR family regulator
MLAIIVDDETTARDLMCDAASRLGYETLCLDNPEQALPMLGRADLVLMDWEMPSMSGLEFVSVARSHGISIPIIMVTVKTDYECIHQAFDAGANDFVSKPINMQDLMARIIREVNRLGQTNGSQPQAGH